MSVDRSRGFITIVQPVFCVELFLSTVAQVARQSRRERSFRLQRSIVRKIVNGGLSIDGVEPSSRDAGSCPALPILSKWTCVGVGKMKCKISTNGHQHDGVLALRHENFPQHHTESTQPSLAKHPKPTSIAATSILPSPVTAIANYDFCS